MDFYQLWVDTVFSRPARIRSSYYQLSKIAKKVEYTNRICTFVSPSGRQRREIIYEHHLSRQPLSHSMVGTPLATSPWLGRVCSYAEGGEEDDAGDRPRYSAATE
jgi:hypothetical protein